MNWITRGLEPELARTMIISLRLAGVALVILLAYAVSRWLASI